MRGLLLVGSLAVSLCAVAVAVGCGGGGGGGESLTAPSLPYPNVAGTWDVTATFDELPPASARVTGTLALLQPSRSSSAITGVANLTALIGGEVIPVTNYAFNATLTTSGTLTFVLGSSPSTWSFVGTLQGNAVTGGRHTLSDGTTSHSGDWTATRASAVAPRTTQTAPAAGDLHKVLRALRCPLTTTVCESAN